jgi:hypothetical protein
MPVLIAFAQWRSCVAEYQKTFSNILIDSGAFSELTGTAKVDIAEFRDWSEPWRMTADAIAGLDDIRGDWRRSLRNYAEIPWGFPTIHDTDPPELLAELIAIARERGRWLGIGLKPPRENKERFVRWVCDNVPEDFHIHGWALRRYTHIRRLDSVDSTNWVRQVTELHTIRALDHLTPSEKLEIVVKRYQRWTRAIREPEAELPLLEEIA